MEKLVGYETAKLAREKGFNIPCRAKIHSSHYHFVVDNVIPKNVGTSNNEMFAPIKDWNNHEEQDHYRQQVTLKGLSTSLPSKAMLQDWLIAVHNIAVLVSFNDNNSFEYYYFIHTDISKPFSNRICSLPIKFNNYDDALELGLMEGLKLIENDINTLTK